VEVQRGFPSTWGGICSADAPRLGSTQRLLHVSALSPQFAAGRLGEADSSQVNCFYHKNKCFLSSLSSQDESTDRNHALPHAALVGHAAGCPLSPQRNGVGRTGKANRSPERSLPLPKKWDAHGMPKNQPHGALPRHPAPRPAFCPKASQPGLPLAWFLAEPGTGWVPT